MQRTKTIEGNVGPVGNVPHIAGFKHVLEGAICGLLVVSSGLATLSQVLHSLTAAANALRAPPHPGPPLLYPNSYTLGLTIWGGVPYRAPSCKGILLWATLGDPYYRKAPPIPGTCTKALIWTHSVTEQDLTHTDAWPRHTLDPECSKTGPRCGT